MSVREDALDPTPNRPASDHARAYPRTGRTASVGGRGEAHESVEAAGEVRRVRPAHQRAHPGGRQRGAGQQSRRLLGPQPGEIGDRRKAEVAPEESGEVRRIEVHRAGEFVEAPGVLRCSVESGRGVRDRRVHPAVAGRGCHTADESAEHREQVPEQQHPVVGSFGQPVLEYADLGEGLFGVGRADPGLPHALPAGGQRRGPEQVADAWVVAEERQVRP